MDVPGATSDAVYRDGGSSGSGDCDLAECCSSGVDLVHCFTVYIAMPSSASKTIDDTTLVTMTVLFFVETEHTNNVVRANA